MTPRHPTSADLAALRASLLAPSIRATGAPVPPPVGGGAWETERREGIGSAWGDSAGRRRRDDRDRAIRARREASAMRSRAASLPVACGAVAWPGTPPGVAPVACQRAAWHDDSHCARLAGCWQWWPRDGAARHPVTIPRSARGGRPDDWIDPAR